MHSHHATVQNSSKTPYAGVIRYYEKLGSRLGYDWIMGGSKHFGLYPDGIANISERRAQELQQDRVQAELRCKVGDRLLDAGCGQGVVSSYLAQHYGLRVSGVTVVPFEVERAQARARRLGVDALTDYSTQDYSATTFADARFDGIYSTETLSHAYDMPKTLREFHRVLKPGGRVAFFEYSIASLQRFDRHEQRVLELFMHDGAMQALPEFQPGRFCEQLQEAGFDDIAEQDVTRQMVPSLRRLQRLAAPAVWVYRLFGIEQRFLNTYCAYEAWKMVQRGVLYYSIFTARKPA